jgi:hypothetical protein
MLARPLALALCSVTLLACAEADERDSIGRFQVEATRTESCGDVGLLASPAQQSYVVALRRVSSKMMQWDDGKSLLSCWLEADGVTFSAQSGMTVDMRSGEQAEDTLPCVVQRGDRLDGGLTPAGGAATSGFEATVRYEFAPTQGSSCDDLLTGAAPIAAALPCAIEYELTGTRLAN